MIPRPRQTVISRPRLLKQLEDAGSKVLLAAPSGYGKTTLLIQMGEQLTREGLKVSWVDARDLYHRRNLTADVLLVDSVRPSDLVQTYGRLDEWSAAQEGRRVFAATNSSDPHTPREWAVVGEDDLKFTEPEIAQLSRALSAPVSVAEHNEVPAGEAIADEASLEAVPEAVPEEIQGSHPPYFGSLAEETGGWPLAVRARVLGEDETQVARGLYQSIPLGPIRTVAALLARVDWVRPVLLPLSMHVSQTVATENLDALVDSSVAVVEEDPDGPRYRLRTSLKPFFRTLSQVSPSTLNEVRRVHALFEGTRRTLHSLETLLDVGDLSSAETLASRHFEHLVDQGPNTLTVLRSKSLKELEEFPLLSMLRLVLERAQKEIPIATVEGFAKDLQARLLDDSPERDPTHQAMLLATQIAVDRMLGMWDSALALSRRAMDMFGDPKWRTDEGRGELPPLLYSVIGLTGILGADYALAQEAADRGFRLASARDNRLEKVQALALSALSSVLLGDVDEAMLYLERFDRLGGYEDLDPPEFSWVNEPLARALLAFHTGETVEGEKALEPVIPLMYRMEQWPIVAVVEAALSRLIRGPYAAHRLLTLRLDQQPENREMPPIWESQLRTQLVTQAIYLGRYEEAQESLDELAADLGLIEGEMLSHVLAQVQLDLYRGDYQRVLGRLETLEDRGTRSRRLTEFALLEALARFRLGDPSTIAEALERLYAREDRSSILSRFPHELVLEAVEETGMEGLAKELGEVPEHLRSYQEVALTEAELRVLRTLARGMTTIEAADHLYNSVNTVKAHRRAIYKKLSVGNWEEAEVAARKRGLLD